MRCPYPKRWKSTQAAPKEPQTIGDHIRKRRLELHLLQSDAAGRIGVCTATLQNWERGIGVPMTRQWPAIIEFLAYDPDLEPKELPAWIAYARQRLGWTQEDLGRALKVNVTTVYRWENGNSMPSSANLKSLERRLGKQFAR